MNYIIFEDNQTHLLNPFTKLHASFEIRTGAYTNIERLMNEINEDDTIQIYAREEVKNILESRFPNIEVNPKIYSPGICLNGKAIWNKKSISEIKKEKIVVKKGVIIGFMLKRNTSNEEFKTYIFKENSNTKDNSIHVMNYLWDIFKVLPYNISEDFKVIKRKLNITKSDIKSTNIHSSCHLINKDRMIISESSIISAGVVLDASNGPIIINENVFIDIGALIKGPAYIGKNSIVNPGSKLRGSLSIGDFCKVGGELEDSIIHGYSNKQHDGYLGHSYLGEWVNLGANTNVSDLKNNYSTVSVMLNENLKVDTKKQFIGSFIGDFTATAISTRFNTGTVVGVGANIFKDSFESKYFPSFLWGDSEKVDLEKFIKRCKIVMLRRDENMTKNLEERLRYLWHASQFFKDKK